MNAGLAVIDDDPTGPQSAAGVSVALRWRTPLLRDSLLRTPTHLLTNSRALAAAEARKAVHSAAAAAWKAGAGQVIMRGDSTLRGHVLPEYLGWVDASAREPVPLVLVPALPASGRVTLGGIHYLVRNGHRVPVTETEYSRDPRFAYSSARLVDWAAERSDGYFDPSGAVEIALNDLRRTRGYRLEDGLARLQQAGPVVCVPDAESLDDLELIGEALTRSLARGARFAIRCSPALAAVLGGSYARTNAAMPSIAGHVLVVCGSHVDNTTRQLAALVARFPDALVELDVRELLTAPSATTEEATRRVDNVMSRSPVAILATSRRFEKKARSATASLHVANLLSTVVRRLTRAPGLVVGKGGVTSAVLAKRGLSGTIASVVGPIAPGISLWILSNGTTRVPFIVFPGNVGDPESLVNLVELALKGGAGAQAAG